MHYGRNDEAAGVVVSQIRGAGGQAEVLQADLAAPDGPHRLASQVHALLGDRLLDVLIANAGISKAATIEKTTLKDFDALYAVNVRAPFFLVQQLLPLLQSGSSVVLVSSMASRVASETLPAYAATKGAVDALVKQLAFALGPRGIRVNAVSPGVIETDMSPFTRTDVGRKGTLAMQALKRIGQPDDVASVITFLASDAASWITGDIIRVDGGSRL